jgi:hypothetical protein
MRHLCGSVWLVLSAVCLSAPALAKFSSDIADRDISLITSKFVSYSMYFGTGQLVTHDSMTCGMYDLSNRTNALLESSIVQCASPRYQPRLLSASHISWRQAEKDDSGVSEPPKTTHKPRKDEDKNSTFIIHNYFGLALLLPDHPFSADLHRTLSVVGGIFPAVTFSVGNGYDFNDLCVQYGITSFPKLLFFKNGLLLGTYKGDHDVVSVASQVSKWTKALPQAVPLSMADNTARRLSYFEKATSSPKFEPIFFLFPDMIDLASYSYAVSAIYLALRLFSSLFTYYSS